LFGESENALVGFCYLFDTGFVLGGTKLELIRVELFPWHAWIACKDFSDCFQRELKGLLGALGVTLRD
jgi:hypothetical protein